MEENEERMEYQVIPNPNHSHFISNKVIHMMTKMDYRSAARQNQPHDNSSCSTSNNVEGYMPFAGTEELQNPAWDYISEDESLKEEVVWVNCTDHKSISEASYLPFWIKRGLPVTNMDTQTEFCDATVLKNIFKAKEIFNDYDEKELYHARSKSNPFESLHSACFMNRAALKMANIDAVTDFMFSQVDSNPHHAKPYGAYYFADVCGGPGGFSEYILWRRHWLFKGFGFTLKGKHNFKLENSKCSPDVTFTAHFGAKGDGNIFSPDNIHSFAELIFNETDSLGVHFMMSDGGFSVEGKEEFQEILSKQLYACQCYTALEIVRLNGHFVTKVFDLFTPFSVGLIYLMYNCFEKIAILKPNTSRPANSERYLICYGLKIGPIVTKIKEHLLEIITILENSRLLKGPSLDIIEIVPISIIKSDEKFCNYIFDSNTKIGINQELALKKLALFCENPHLTESRQEQLRINCLKYWNIPLEPQLSIFNIFTTESLAGLLNERDCLTSQPTIINSFEELQKTLINTAEWHYVPTTTTTERTTLNVYAVVDRHGVYRLQSSWIKIKKLKLFCGSVIFGEMVTESDIKPADVSYVGKKQTLQIIDALRLGSCDISQLPFTERQKLIYTYCEALNHECRKDYTRVRAKPMNILNSLSSHSLISYDDNKKRYLSSLPLANIKNICEYYYINSVLLCHTHYGIPFDQLFSSCMTIILKDEHNCGTNSSDITLNTLINFISNLS